MKTNIKNITPAIVGKLPEATAKNIDRLAAYYSAGTAAILEHTAEARKYATAAAKKAQKAAKLAEDGQTVETMKTIKAARDKVSRAAEILAAGAITEAQRWEIWDSYFGTNCTTPDTAEGMKQEAQNIERMASDIYIIANNADAYVNGEKIDIVKDEQPEQEATAPETAPAEITPKGDETNQQAQEAPAPKEGGIEEGRAAAERIKEAAQDIARRIDKAHREKQLLQDEKAARGFRKAEALLSGLCVNIPEEIMTGAQFGEVMAKAEELGKWGEPNVLAYVSGELVKAARAYLGETPPPPKPMNVSWVLLGETHHYGRNRAQETTAPATNPAEAAPEGESCAVKGDTGEDTPEGATTPTESTTEATAGTGAPTVNDLEEWEDPEGVELPAEPDPVEYPLGVCRYRVKRGSFYKLGRFVLEVQPESGGTPLVRKFKTLENLMGWLSQWAKEGGHVVEPCPDTGDPDDLTTQATEAKHGPPVGQTAQQEPPVGQTVPEGPPVGHRAQDGPPGLGMGVRPPSGVACYIWAIPFARTIGSGPGTNQQPAARTGRAASRGPPT